MGGGEIVTTEGYHSKVGVCLSFFKADVNVRVVEDYKFASDKDLLERYYTFIIALENLSNAYDNVYLYTNIICLLEPVRSPDNFKLPFDKKEWYHAITGKRMKFTMEDIDNVYLISQWFPVFDDLSVLISKIILQFRGSVNISLSTLEDNIFRAARATISKKMILEFMNDNGLTFEQAKDMTNSIIDDKKYLGVYEVRDAMIKTLVNWSNRTGYVTFETVGLNNTRVFISKLELKEDIEKIVSLSKSITLPSFVIVNSENYKSIDDIYENEATNIRYERYDLIGDDIKNSINHLQSIGWKVSEVGLMHYKSNFENVLIDKLHNINNYTDTMLSAILYNAIDKPFYYRCGICHRGRIYYMCTNLSPQSNAYSQSLLTFSIFKENNFEIMSQINIMTSIASSKLGYSYTDGELYTSYGDVGCIDYIKDPIGYVNKFVYGLEISNIPLRKDLTSSYWQLMGLIFEDFELLELSNMVKDEPIDWGSDIAERISKETNINVTRSDVKMTVMKIVYGSNVASISKEMSVDSKGIPKLVVNEMSPIMERLKKYRSSVNTMIALNLDMKLLTESIINHDSKNIYVEIGNVIKNINNSITKNKINDQEKFNENISKFKILIFKIGDIKKIVEYLSSIQTNLRRINYIEESHYHVDNFISMPVKAYILKKKIRTILVIDINDKNKFRRIDHSSLEVTNNIDYNKTWMALFVNFIHSLDAKVNALVIEHFRKNNKNIASIHDCWMCEPKSIGELNNVVFDSMKRTIPKTSRLIHKTPKNFLRYYSTNVRDLEYSTLKFKITPNNQNKLKVQLKTILMLIENNKEHFKKRIGVRLNIVTKFTDGSFKTIGGPYGSTFLHLKGIIRSKKELCDLFEFVNTKITYSQETYESWQYEPMSYLTSIYIMSLDSVRSDILEKIIIEYENIDVGIHSSYTNNNPSGKRMLHTIITLNSEKNIINIKKYENFIKAIIEHKVLPDNFMTLVNVKLLNSDIYNQVLECCMDKDIKVNLSPFRDYSKHRLIKIKDIWKHIEGIRVWTIRPKLTKKKLESFNWGVEVVMDHNDLYKLKSIRKEDLKLWYLLLTRQSLYIPENNLVKSIWDIGDYSLTRLALSGYTKCVEITLGNCRKNRIAFKPNIGLGIINKFDGEKYGYNKICDTLINSCNSGWGVFDIETTSEFNENMRVYACGLQISENIKIFYGEKSVEDMVKYLWQIEWYKPIYNEEIINWIMENKNLIKSNIDCDKMVEIIRSKSNSVETNNLTLLAHNASRFDTNFVVELCKLSRDDNLIMRNNQILSVTIKNGDRTIKIIDSMQHLVGSLIKVSKDFNVREEKGIFPYSWYNEDMLGYIGNKPPVEKFLENKKEEEKENVIKMWKDIKEPFNAKNYLNGYLKSDLIMLTDTLNKYIKESINQNGINPINYIGAPSYSNNVFKANHVETKLITEDWMTESFVRKSYFGGRNEIYKFHTDKGYVNDINSSYPWAMTQPMPDGKGVYYMGDPGKSFGFIRADVQVNSDFKIPILPVRKDGLLIFPTGSFSGTWFSEELNYAEENGYIVNRKEGIIYDKSYNTFKSFVEKFYRIKKDSENSSQSKIAKLILVSLYGKLGSRDIYSKNSIEDYNNQLITSITETRENTIIKSIEPGCINQRDILKYLNVNGIKYVINPNMVQEIEKDKRTNIVQLASAITAYGRIKLHKAMSEEGIGLIYVDTDSVFSEKGLSSNYIGDEIGEWDFKRISELWICNNKMYSYRVENEIKQQFAFKGIRDTSIARYCEFLVNGKIRLIISEELVFKKNDFKIKPMLLNKKTEIVYKKREIISELNNNKTVTYTCMVGINGIGEMIENEKLENNKILIDTKPIVLNGYDGDLEKEKNNILTQGLSIDVS